MVFFSCNACGQSVKKNQVEKHYQLQCRNCEVLSCVDCGKEFKGDLYKGHTRCISEEEKYGGKDFKQTQSVNKGEVKQDKWIENIQSTIAAAKVPRPVFSLLERLLTYSNIPRKQGKFERFLQNSLRVSNPRLISEVWDVVGVVNQDKSGQKEVCASKHEANSEKCSLQEELPRKKGKDLGNEDDVKERQIELVYEQENGIGKKKKKHKCKTPKEAKTETCENCNGEGCASCKENYKPKESEDEQINSIKKKKKHKRKKKATDDENGVENNSNEPVVREDFGGETASSKEYLKDNQLEHEQVCSEPKKKKKRKKGAAPDEANTVGELESEMDRPINEEKKQFNGSGYEEIYSVAKKKKKHKREKGKASDEENGIHVDDNKGEKGKECNSGQDQNELDPEQITSATKKKKKRKSGSHEVENHSEENNEQEVLQGHPESKKRKKNKVEDTETELQCKEVKSSSKKRKKSKH